jgi:hypothetical protein
VAIPGMTSGDSKPILKYDARTGRWKIDKREISSITMIVDVENAEAGWLRFKEGSTPQFRMVPVRDLLNGAPYPESPDPDPNSGWRRGFRCTVKLPDKFADGRASVREWASGTYATVRGFDPLHDAFLAAYRNYPGKVPVVTCTEVKEQAGQHGPNYTPILRIIKWVDRPKDLQPSAPVADDDIPPFDPGEPEIRGDDEPPEDFGDFAA